MFCSASDLYIQWGFIYPGARYLDASVYGGFFLGTDFSYMYIVLSRLTGIPRFRFGQPVLCRKTLFNYHFATLNRSVKFNDTQLNSI